MMDIKELKSLTQTFKVLYAEDDVSLQNSMSSYLKKLFFKVEIVNNGVDGLKKYKEQNFDIVITDLSMPKMNGLEMLSKIREINKNQAILITSAHSESSYMVSAIKLGIDGYIIKPFDYEQLNYELHKITEKLKIYAENEQYKKHLQQMVDEKTADIAQMMLFQSDNYEKSLISMVEMIEDRDSYTAGHSKRVAEYSKIIAEQMKYSEEECMQIYSAGILHDVGKVATPDAVLLNPKTLNDIEYQLIQEHVEVGYRLLSHIPMFEILAEIIRSHHERYDGKGYPRGLEADEIPPLARIMIVADAFDAMTTNRIYKARKSVSEALDELVKLKSMQFHPDVVDNALIALKDIKIDKSINQLPKTKLEEERFAYFYHDTVCDIYNQKYLDVLLMRNSYEENFKYLDVIFLNHFSNYNKAYSWNSGDKFLQNIAKAIKESFPNSLIFRAFGDDFAVASKEKISFEHLNIKLDELIKSTPVKYNVVHIDLQKTDIHTSSQLESLE